MAQLGVQTRCELTVTGPVAESVIQAIAARFDVDATRTSDHTLLTVDCVDQAAVRALMTMLWDSGHQVVTMSTAPPHRPTIPVSE
jgi:hypothetical protein